MVQGAHLLSHPNKHVIVKTMEIGSRVEAGQSTMSSVSNSTYFDHYPAFANCLITTPSLDPLSKYAGEKI